MIDILLLPFMCLSLAQEGAKAEGKPYSVNEITSCVDFNTKSGQTRRKTSSSRTIIEEASFEHASYGRAQSIGTFGIQDEDIEVRGNESQFNKTDVYSFRVTDRIRAHFRFGIWGADRRVALLLAMTVLNLCHSEEAQRADVGIRPFYDGRGFGPPYLGHGLRRPNFVPKFGASVKSSAPTESQINHPSQRRAAKRLSQRGRGTGKNRCGGHQ